jgi:DNA invertase Pin-like site-specific DNA recombinase
MAIIGYARVSTEEQHLDIQIDKLKGCDKIYQETQSATNYDRPELQKCLDYVRDGDTLVCSRLDRLARSTLHLCQIAELLEKKGVALKVIDQSIDTSSPTGRLLFNMLAAIAQFETELRAERQRDGIVKAKSRGVEFGRKFALDNSQIIDLKAKRKSGILIKELMREYSLSKATIYKYLSQSESITSDDDSIAA